MKTNLRKSRLVIAFLPFALLSCAPDGAYNIPEIACTETSLLKNMEVNQVVATPNISQHTGDDIIEAYVTSSDEGGNFFKTISFQTLDGLSAFSMPIDAAATFINFEPGRKVLIKLKNLYTDVSDGGVRIGSIYVSNGVAEVGRVPQMQYRDILVRSCTVLNEDFLVKNVTINELASNSYINKLVELNGVQFTADALGKHYYEENNDIGGATNYAIEDAVGGSIIFRTSSYSNFAHKIVPGKSGKIRGVLTKFGDTFQFMARTENDIRLADDRFEVNPLFIEDFQSASDGTNLNIPGWTNFAESGNKFWKEEAFDNSGYAEFSAYGSGNALNIVWLISPAINISMANLKVLRFKVAQHHLDVDSPDNSLQVLISTDFDGSNVLSATWNPVDANLPTTATEWYEWLDSVVDISSVSGQLYVAFKFKGSGTNTALDGAFEVDDVKIYGQ
jgi:hypothetical protein